MNHTELPPRIRANILVDDCWIWSRCTDQMGYGRISWQLKNAKVATVVYELLIGPIPRGYHLHHLCKNKRCCNPVHLLPVTAQEHMDMEPRNQFRGRTHCMRGHPFDELNTRHVKQGKYTYRSCKLCRRERDHRYYLERKTS